MVEKITMKNYCLLFFAIVMISCQTKKDGNLNDHDLFSNQNENEMNAENFREGVDYQIFERYRILDNEGYAQSVEASSILLPKDWTISGGIKWIRPGQPCEGTTLSFSATSSDGKFKMEFMPGVLWSKSDDPQMAMINSQLSTEGCFRETTIPASAEEYLRGAFSQSIGNPSIQNIKPNQDVVRIMSESDQKTYNELMSNGASDMRIQHEAISADLDWNNGTAGIALIGFTNGYVSMQNRYTGTFNTFYTGNASTRILFSFPDDQKELAKQIFTTAISSIRTNPEWKNTTDNYWKTMREESRRITADKVAMLDRQTQEIANRAIANGNSRLAALDNQMRSWESKPSSNDNSTANFVKAIREVENFTDASGTVEVPSGYNQVWNSNDGSGTYIMSNNPNFDPSSAFQDQRWQQMQKVE